MPQLQPAPTPLRAEPRAADECRCLCGSLLARVTRAGVELKCRRCKRTLLVPLPPRSEAARPAPVREIG